MVIRAAGPRDHAALLDMMEEFNRAERVEMRREVAGPALSRLLADDSLGRALIADEGYALLTWGFDLEFGGRDAFLTEIFVRPESRRTGAGRALLEAVLRAAREAGAGAVHLGVYPDNDAALALYRAAGFTRIPRDFYSKRL